MSIAANRTVVAGNRIFIKDREAVTLFTLE